MYYSITQRENLKIPKAPQNKTGSLRGGPKETEDAIPFPVLSWNDLPSQVLDNPLS